MLVTTEVWLGVPRASFLEESRTKQFKAIKGIWGDERIEHPNDGWVGTLWPQKLVPHSSPGNSKLGLLGRKCTLGNSQVSRMRRTLLY